MGTLKRPIFPQVLVDEDDGCDQEEEIERGDSSVWMTHKERSKSASYPILKNIVMDKFR